MIAGSLTSRTGGPVLLLGLTGENVTRLVSGEPGTVTAARMRELGLPEIDVIIVCYGRTDEDLLAELIAGDYVSPGTVTDLRQ